MEQYTLNDIHASETIKWDNHFVNHLAVYYNIKHTLTLRPSNFTKYLLKRNENI